MNNLRQRTLTGLGWSGANQFVGQVLQLAAAVILARLLTPKDYGLLGMVLVFTGFANSLADLGLAASIIHKSDLSDRHLDSVFWINVATGGLLTVLFILVAPFIASIFHEPRLRLLTAVIAINFLLASLNVVQNALLEKSLNFRTKFWIETASALTSGIVALVLAFTGAGVWSLVGQLLTSTVVRVGVMWGLSAWRPALSFELSAVKELMHFGGNLAGFGIVMYWSKNIDKLVIGRWIGSAALGFYNLADRLMRLPLTNVTDITTVVMFPALSAVQDEVGTVTRAYLRGTRMIALLTFPMMIGLSVLAEPAILVVYGGQWRAAIVILQLLCFAGMARSVYDTASWIFLSQGRTDVLFRLGIYSTGVRAAGVLVGAHWGLVGVAWAYVLGSYLFLLYPTWSQAGRLLNLGFGELLKNVAGPFACAASMGILLWMSDHWIFGSSAVGMRLAAQVVLGALVYGFLVRFLRLESWVDLENIILERGGERNRFMRWLGRGNSRADA
jgi:O-antigen/teichoic acid export membrane protein